MGDYFCWCKSLEWLGVCGAIFLDWAGFSFAEASPHLVLFLAVFNDVFMIRSLWFIKIL